MGKDLKPLPQTFEVGLSRILTFKSDTWGPFGIQTMDGETGIYFRDTDYGTRLLTYGRRRGRFKLTEEIYQSVFGMPSNGFLDIDMVFYQTQDGKIYMVGRTGVGKPLR